ncbi:hypothetical protein [Clostridium estertheticum]|uniref:hypothetical protein n=1 Tax=Clostridium estertheticum TaxID=238834 RepID=UPI00209B628B|nr:hypothetical protein [Clostridium estertheticum]
MGDIDNDGTLEVAVFERNYSSEEYIPSNIQLFKYTDGEYSLFSTVKTTTEHCMSIDISKAKDDINGVFVSGIMGMHSGEQSLYIIKDGELTPAIDDIYSLYPSKIKDIDGDGLLELSSLERDPNDPDSSNATCSKILPYIVVLVVALTRFNVVLVLVGDIILATIIGLIYGSSTLCKRYCRYGGHMYNINTNWWYR